MISLNECAGWKLRDRSTQVESSVSSQVAKRFSSKPEIGTILQTLAEPKIVAIDLATLEGCSTLLCLGIMNLPISLRS